jgi:hypothetical protein
MPTMDNKLTIEDVEDNITEGDQNPFNVYGAQGITTAVHLTLPGTSSF